MCLTALAIGMSAQWPLLLASNRDEFHHRPTLPLARWTGPAGQPLISGRDLEAGGTWLGLSAAGRLALLTNVREPGAEARARSRGELALAWLSSQADATDFFAGLEPQAYNGFNLLIGDVVRGRWHWASNRQPHDGEHGQSIAPGWQQQALQPGIYGLSNAFLDTPWPKTLALKEAVRSALTPGQPALQGLWQALEDSTPAPWERCPRTGIAPERELQLSSAFVRMADGHYGTRASTLLVAEAVPGGLALHMQEKSWPAQGPATLREERLHCPA